MPLRVIPVLLIENGKLIKTKRFTNPVYVGDPINAIRVFNEKEVDEIFIIDKSARIKNAIDYDLLYEMASECFMPITYGGGISNLEQIGKILNLGIERVSLNYSGLTDLVFLKSAIKQYGSSTIVLSVDFKKFGKDYRIVINNGTINLEVDAFHFLNSLNEIEIGELLINSIDNDGGLCGYDYVLLEKIMKTMNKPVTVLGGAGSVSDFVKAAQLGVSAVAAGSYFVFWGPHKAVLINYLNKEELMYLYNL